MVLSGLQYIVIDWQQRALTMKFEPKVLVALSTAALTACGSPQYSKDTAKSEALALAQVSPDVAVARTRAIKLSGKFENDLSRAIRAWPDYIAAQSAAAEARAMITVSEAARKPQLQASSNLGTLTQTGAGIPTSSTNGASASVTMNQIIYDGGASLAAIDGAQVTAYAAELETQVVANTAAYNAGATWIDAQTIKARQRALAAVMSKADEMLGQIDTLVSSGMADKSASTSADIAVRNLELEQSQLDASRHEVTARYIKQFGSPPKDLSQPPKLLTQADLAKVQKDWASSPSLLQSAAGVLSARQALLVAQGREKPTIGLSSGVTSPMSPTDQSSYAVGFEVSWIIGDGGRRKAGTAAKAARLDASKQALEGLKLQGKSQLDTAVSQREALLRSLTMLSAQNTAASKEIEILWSQLAIGQTTVRQLIDAEVSAYRTADRQITAKAELAKLELQMLATSGLLAKKLGLNDTQAPLKATK